MVQARRAKASPIRVVIPIVAAAVLVGGGIAVATQFHGRPTTAAGPTPTVGATVATADSSGASASTSSAAESTPTATTSAATPAAAKMLRSCREKVRAADLVLAEAKTGIAHWRTHVQAQTDANHGDITVEKMEGKFAATRLAGPADQKRYRSALSAYSDAHGSCRPVAGAEATVASALSRCNDRARAQRPVLAAAADGMKDWQDHLAAMRRSRMTHVDDAEGVWLRAWRAAPTHLKAYAKAVDRYDPPSC